jgi:ribokinase
MIVVAGLINLETTLKVDAFPLAYEPVRFPFFGIQSRVAGVGFNLSKALTTLGSPVNLLSLMGQDDASRLARQAVQGLGISEGYLIESLGHQPQSVILYEPSGQRMIHSDLKDIQDKTYPAEQFIQALADASLAVLCNINFSRGLLPVAKAKGITIATDVHTINQLDHPYNQDYMAAANILFQSHEKLPASPQHWAEQVMGRYANDVVVVGLGTGGALLKEQGKPIQHVPAIAPRPVVNTIGAGDALFAGFLHFYSRGMSALESLNRAVLFAGYKIGADGAAEGFLSEAELERLYQAGIRE